jgi:hypothetical protein
MLLRWPQVAIVELVANSWDAGADRVEITRPRAFGETPSVADKGTGMTLVEFQKRRPTLDYNRAESQGSAMGVGGGPERVVAPIGRDGPTLQKSFSAGLAAAWVTASYRWWKTIAPCDGGKSVPPGLAGLTKPTTLESGG